MGRSYVFSSFLVSSRGLACASVQVTTLDTVVFQVKISSKVWFQPLLHSFGYSDLGASHDKPNHALLTTKRPYL